MIRIGSWQRVITAVWPTLLLFAVLLGNCPETFAAGTFANTYTNMSSPRRLHTATVMQTGDVLIAGGFFDNMSSAVGKSEIFNRGSGRFTKTAAPMNIAVGRHTATLLKDGSILIAGGKSESGPSNTLQMFDPATGTYSTHPTQLAVARYDHTATLLTDGRVMFCGGKGIAGNILASCEIFDPKTGIKSSVSMNTSRWGHTATMMPDGKVFIIGGFDGTNYLQTTEVFNGSGFTYSTSTYLLGGRAEHTATLLVNGKVLIVAGRNAGGSLDSHELIDTAGTDNFYSTSITARLGHSAALLPNGKVLITGGIVDRASGNYSTLQSYLFDPFTNQFTAESGSMAFNRFDHNSVLLPNGTVLITGGEMGNNAVGAYTPFMPIDSAEVYNSQPGNSQPSGNMTAARSTHSSTLVPTSPPTVLVAGGLDTATTVAKSADLYDASAGTFSATQIPMLSSHQSHAAVLLPSGKVAIFGGYSSAPGQANYQTTAMNKATIYTPGSGFAAVQGVMTSSRGQHSATLLKNGEVLIAGGNNGNNVSDMFADVMPLELFDPATGTFTTPVYLSSGHSRHTATLLKDGRVLIAGGTAYPGGSTNSAVVFDPSNNTLSSQISMTQFRAGHTATLLPDGRVLIVGGYASLAPSIEIFDPGTNTFSTLSGVTEDRTDHTATLLPNGLVVLAGGRSIYTGMVKNTVSTFDPVTQNLWTGYAVLGTCRYGHTATLLPNGFVLIAGGAGMTGNCGTAGTASELSSSETFTPSLGYLDSSVSRKVPILTSPFDLLTSILAGTNFTGDSEASGGGTNNSAGNYPLVTIQSVQNEILTPIPSYGPLMTDFWSNTYFGTSPPWVSLPMGHYFMTMFTAGMTSNSLIVENVPKIELLLNGGTVAGTLTFPNTPISATSADQVFKVTNNGTFPLEVPLPQLSGTEPGMYFVGATVSGAPCSFPQTLSPGSSCEFKANFVPMASGNLTALLTITTNDPKTPKIDINLSGTAYVANILTVTKTGSGTVTANSGAINCGSTCTGYYNPGTLVTLSAESNAGYTFVEWSGACSGTAKTCVVTMDAEKNVNATFNTPTPVSGIITANTTWTRAGGPYQVTGSITVNAGATLNIEAGTIIKFVNGTGLTVNGSLNAVGTAGNLIYFTSIDNDSVGGDTNGNGAPTYPLDPRNWNGIYVGNNGSATFDYCTIGDGGWQGGAQNGVLVKTGAGNFTVTNSSISNYDYNGIYLVSVTGIVMLSNNTITGGGYYGTVGIKVDSSGSVATISGNSILNNTNYGISIVNSSPAIIGGNSITGGAQYGIYATGTSVPVLDGSNTLTGNTSGAMAFDAMASGIASNYDAYTTEPVYVYGAGIFTGGTTTWSSSRIYVVRSSLTVNSGATLAISAGGIVKFASGTGLTVNGTLNAIGSSAKRIYFTSIDNDSVGGDTNNNGVPAYPLDPRNWNGIYINSGGVATFDYCNVSDGGWMSGLLYKTGSGALTITNSQFSNYYYYGIVLPSVTGIVTLTGNTITGGGYYGQYGIKLDSSGSVATISGNSILNSGTYGIQLVNSSPSITGGNSITGGLQYGIYVGGTSAPVLDGSNTLTGNTIGGMAFDPPASGIASNYDSYLTEPVNIATGTLNSGTTTWSSARIYYIRGQVTVPVGATLTIPAGRILKFNATGLTVNGTLNATGALGNPIYFTSYRNDSIGGDTNGDGATTPGQSDWYGIGIANNGTATIDYCDLSYGGWNSGLVYKTGAGAIVVSNSQISNFYYYGIQLNATTSAIDITGNDFTGGGSYGYYGVYLNNAGSPTITANKIHSATSYGIYAVGATSTPGIYKNAIYNNNVGVYVNSAANPVIGGSSGNGNNLYNNTAYSVQNATASTPPNINATYNYWGSAAGPYHVTTNSGGNATSKVSDFVDYANYSPAPSGSIAINGGAAATGATSVNLTLACSETSGCAQMEVSNDNFASSSKFAFAPSLLGWSLPSGEGSKTVSVKFQYGNGSWSSVYSATINLDTTPPVVVIGSPSVSSTTAGPVTFTVTYSDANFGSSTLTSADITLNATGTATGTAGVSGTGLTRTVTISGISGYGTLGITLAANTAADLAGNPAPSVGPSATVTVTAAQTINFGTPPTLTYGGGTGSVSATGGASGQPVMFSSLTTSVCTISGSIVTPLTAGVCTIAADQAGDANYNAAAQATLSFAVAKAVATVTLGGLSQTYDGTLKTASATTVPAGLAVLVTYDGSIAAPINAGSYVVVATVSDPNYSGSASGTLVVGKATPVISWATPTAITYGMALSGTQLNAATAPSGTFIYTPAAGSVLGAGTQVLSTTFTPADTTNYNTATSTVSVTVNKADATIITWPTASAITYGQTLASSILSGGSSTPTGSFAFTAPTTAPSSGTASQSVTFTPSDFANYNTATSTVSVTVNKADASITWPTASAITYGQTLASSTLSGGSSTPTGSFAFTAPTSAPNAGTASQSVTFTPGDPANYNTATSTVSVTVNKADASITWPTASAITYGQTLASSTLSGGSSTPTGSFAFTAPTTAPNAGTASQSVTFTPGDPANYNTATSTVSVTVNKATPAITWSAPVDIVYGTPLSAAQLNATASVPGSFVYSPASGSLPATGTQTLSVTFTPTDSTNYAIQTATVGLNVTALPANQVTTGADGVTTVPVTVTASGATVSLPAGIKLTDASGNPISGTLTVKPLVVMDNPLSLASMVPALAQTADGKVLSVLGNSIDITISAGATNVKNITPAMIVTLPVSPAFALPGATVSYYSFDGSIWRLEGSAIVKPDGTVDMQVSHLSIWAVAAFKASAGLPFSETFDLGTVPSGWSLTPNNGNATDDWQFSTTGNTTGGTGGFATINTFSWVTPKLQTPALDMSAASKPTLEFKTSYTGGPDTLTADVSIDGGVNWTNVWSWHSTTNAPIPASVVTQDISAVAANQSNVMVRFVFSNGDGIDVSTWMVDDVKIYDSSALLDIVAPVVTTFTAPATSSTLAIAGIAVTATDNVAVTGYLLSESATPPSASDLAWASVAPTTFTFPTWGNHTLYAYAKDAAGNVSAASASAVVLVGTTDGVIIQPLLPTDPPASREPQLADALKSLNFAMKVEIPTATDLQHGDVAPLVNGLPQPDGVINLGDTIVMLRRVVGL